MFYLYQLYLQLSNDYFFKILVDNRIRGTLYLSIGDLRENLFQRARNYGELERKEMRGSGGSVSHVRNSSAKGRQGYHLRG